MQISTPARVHRVSSLLGCLIVLGTAGPISAPAQTPTDSPAPQLLFYLSADKGTTADLAAPGTAEPNFVSEINAIADGAKGAALHCGNLQRLSWWAPGNIYAQRGTLSFFWRAHDPVGPTEFPVFRVGYADHSSWDMAWLRIDYNGHGFDAFVTDASLSRTRVSVKLDPFPKPTEWIHLTLAWDETRGIRFYVNGKLAAENKTTARYDAALDQFGPHSRIISPYQVQSDYNFTRGGDIDEVRIYDRMVSDGAAATLAKGDAPTAPAPAPATTPSLADAATRDEWFFRYGWNRPNDPPAELPAGRTVSVRKVEIHDAFDLKRWWWKATDGIRETTWPGVYNRSRLPGRWDYFTLPDWDCYVESGKAVTFALPNEPWNHLEISGSAWGKMELLTPGGEMENASSAPAARLLFQRPKAQEKTVHAFSTALTGGKIRFTNVEPEEPIGELSAYHVARGTEPAGSTKLAFHLGDGSAQEAGNAIGAYIWGRFPVGERQILVAHPAGESVVAASPLVPVGPQLPLVHVLIPNTWDKLTDGLDGIAIDLPALNLPPTHGNLIAFNLQVKDPLWPLRAMFDFSFSVKPGEAKTLWLDLRDRILPAGKPLYLTIASASGAFDASTLHRAEVRLVFKSREAARPEHELDRFTQARDSYAMLVEEHPRSPKYNLWNRFEADLTDLLRVNPEHELGRQYAAAGMGGPRPAFTQPEAPAGVPLWAFRQTELLGRVKKFVLWYIDHRQVAYGDFGGGISDDVDLTNTWPGLALMGSEPEKIQASLHALLEAAFKNGMFTNGLPTLQADELHSYEEGINCLAQNLLLDYGSPLQLERAMVTARGVAGITGVNAAGHRHVRSSYYSGTKMAEEGPWGWSKPYSYLVLHPDYLLIDFNGSPEAKKIVNELADGLLAHYHPGTGARAGVPSAIHFATDAEAEATRNMLPWPLLWSSWRSTGDKKYLAPIMDGGLTTLGAVNANSLDLLSLRDEWKKRLVSGETVGANETRRPDGRARSPDAAFRTPSTAHFTWQLTGDKTILEKLYAEQIEQCALLEFINTQGSLWIDRVGAPTAELQRARLGGAALVRNSLYPGHVVSWKFPAPANDQSVAILLPNATPTEFKVIAYNLETKPVQTTMTGWDVAPGQWEITQGVDGNNDDTADGELASRTADFERSRSLDFTLPPRATTVITLKLKTAGTPYWQRPDLGIDRQDVSINGRNVRVTLHSLGSVRAPASQVGFRDASGKVIARVATPALEAPNDLLPKTTTVTIALPAGVDAARGTIEIDPDRSAEEITRLNNVVKL
jgi:Concanavalin A-like lectin/glucanases superfamily